MIFIGQIFDISFVGEVFEILFSIEITKHSHSKYSSFKHEFFMNKFLSYLTFILTSLIELVQ